MAVTISILSTSLLRPIDPSASGPSLHILEDGRALPPQKFLKQLLRTAYRIGNLKTTLNLCATAQSHFPSFVAVTQENLKGAGERKRVILRDKQPGLRVADHLGYAANVGCDDRY